jgi:hypothetical protein
VQQKTVRDIRAAIAPQPPPPMEARLYLPEQFAEHLTLPDDAALEQERNGNSGFKEGEKGSIGNQGPDSVNLDAKQKPLVVVDDTKPTPDVISEEQPNAEPVVELEGKKKKEKKESAAERRKRIKQEALAAGEGEGFKGYRRRMW